MERKIFSMLSRSQLIGIGVMASAVTVAGAVSLTSFTPGTTISASAVNANFQALNNALPLVWSNVDESATLGGSFIGGGTPAPRVMNTLPISAPAAGHLILAGSVYVKNNEASAITYDLMVLIDGNTLHGGGFVASAKLQPSGNADNTTLAYTVTLPISAGSHTITQQLKSITPTNSLVDRPAVSAAHFADRAFLTATFVPAISGYNQP
jgi:hypothetical protein